MKSKRTARIGTTGSYRARRPTLGIVGGNSAFRRKVLTDELESTGEPTPQIPTPEAVPVVPATTVSLTPKAVEMVRHTRQQEGLDETDGLRVAVSGGGCSGFQYALDFDKEPRATDQVLEFDGLRVFVDPVSARYLKGTVIDYVLGMQGAGFKFINPNAVGSCGCGSSFSV